MCFKVVGVKSNSHVTLKKKSGIIIAIIIINMLILVIFIIVNKIRKLKLLKFYDS